MTAVSNVVGGSASVSGGNVLFTPTADFDGAASFDYTVTDNGTTNGVAHPLAATATASFSVTAVNDLPTVGGDMAIAVASGGTVPVTAADLTATDSDNTNSQLVYTVTGALHGAVLLAGVAAASFTEVDILANAVSFQHDDSATTALHGIATDGTSPPQEATVIAAVDLPANAAPTITSDGGGATASDIGRRECHGCDDSDGDRSRRTDARLIDRRRRRRGQVPDQRGDRRAIVRRGAELRTAD